jgi:hypothetical protein
VGMDKFEKKKQRKQPTTSKERRGIFKTFINIQNGFDQNCNGKT